MSDEQYSYPLSWPKGWPRWPAGKWRECARFGKRDKTNGVKGALHAVSLDESIDRLLQELRTFTDGLGRQRVDRIAVSTNIPLRRDGYPRRDQEPSDCGVAVYFSIDENRTVLACDKWNRTADNIAAIAAHLNALRGQERWGVGTMAQAFAGYVALNEKTGPSCWETLGVSPDAPEQQILDAYRRKARESHPDNGGSSDAFVEVTKAKDIALASVQKVA